ncbi:MAG TPA: DUF1501 domain-containing protein [Humisphaera sp.]|nr:DUF1501 domain-containing protein [Humisphaera sp.]
MSDILTNPFSRDPRFAGPMSRRQLLTKTAGGFGAVALAALLAEDNKVGASVVSAATATTQANGGNPLAIRAPHFAARAKRVIFLFMPGGPSQVDTFDPKPRLTRDNGKPIDLDVSKLVKKYKTKTCLASPFKFAKHGQSGLDVSELFPNVAGCADDLCVIRSMVHEDPNHPGGCFLMNTGNRVFSRPSIGSWVTYGLGAENQDLPGFIAIGPGQPLEGCRQYSSSFLPSAYGATFVSDMTNPIRNLRERPVSLDRQRRELDAIRELNQLQLHDPQQDRDLCARIESFELAYRMQANAPDAFDLTGESQATKKLYGIDAKPTDAFGRQCLLARRLIERGVRFVQLFDTQGGFQPWDQHQNLKSGHANNAARTDLPIAGLLKDLKSRGLLEDTLVLWGGEFGRTPTSEGKDGRDHHPYGFTMWLAGGGVKSGTIYGATDEFGWNALPDQKVHVHDLHATILHLLGLDHQRLTYRYGGRDYRLTDVYGNVVKGILA